VVELEEDLSSAVEGEEYRWWCGAHEDGAKGVVLSSG
jgi:hypothetical protein